MENLEFQIKYCCLQFPLPCLRRLWKSEYCWFCFLLLANQNDWYKNSRFWCMPQNQSDQHCHKMTSCIGSFALVHNAQWQQVTHRHAVTDRLSVSISIDIATTNVASTGHSGSEQQQSRHDAPPSTLLHQQSQTLTLRAQLSMDQMKFRPVASLPALHPLQPYLRIHLYPNRKYQRRLCNLRQIKVLDEAAAGRTALRLLQHFSIDISIVFTKRNVEYATVDRSNRGSKRHLVA